MKKILPLIILTLGLFVAVWQFDQVRNLMPRASEKETKLRFKAVEGYQPGEKLSAWAVLSDNRRVDLPTPRVDSSGKVAFVVNVTPEDGWPGGNVQVHLLGSLGKEAVQEFNFSPLSLSVVQEDSASCIRSGGSPRGQAWSRWNVGAGECRDITCGDSCCHDDCRCSGTCGADPTTVVYTPQPKTDSEPTLQGSITCRTTAPNSAACAGDKAYGECKNRPGADETQCGFEANNAYLTRFSEEKTEAQKSANPALELAKLQRQTDYDNVETYLRRAAACKDENGKTLTNKNECLDPNGGQVNLPENPAELQKVVDKVYANGQGCPNDSNFAKCVAEAGKVVTAVSKPVTHKPVVSKPPVVNPIVTLCTGKSGFVKLQTGVCARCNGANSKEFSCAEIERLEIRNMCGDYGYDSLGAVPGKGCFDCTSGKEKRADCLSLATKVCLEEIVGDEQTPSKIHACEQRRLTQFNNGVPPQQAFTLRAVASDTFVCSGSNTVTQTVVYNDGTRIVNNKKCDAGMVCQKGACITPVGVSGSVGVELPKETLTGSSDVAVGNVKQTEHRVSSDKDLQVINANQKNAVEFCATQKIANPSLCWSAANQVLTKGGSIESGGAAFDSTGQKLVYDGKNWSSENPSPGPSITEVPAKPSVSPAPNALFNFGFVQDLNNWFGKLWVGTTQDVKKKIDPPDWEFTQRTFNKIKNHNAGQTCDLGDFRTDDGIAVFCAPDPNNKNIRHFTGRCIPGMVSFKNDTGQMLRCTEAFDWELESTEVSGDFNDQLIEEFRKSEVERKRIEEKYGVDVINSQQYWSFSNLQQLDKVLSEIPEYMYKGSKISRIGVYGNSNTPFYADEGGHYPGDLKSIYFTERFEFGSDDYQKKWLRGVIIHELTHRVDPPAGLNLLSDSPEFGILLNNRNLTQVNGVFDENGVKELRKLNEGLSFMSYTCSDKNNKRELLACIANMYYTNPVELKNKTPEFYDFAKTRIFEGKEYLNQPSTLSVGGGVQEIKLGGNAYVQTSQKPKTVTTTAVKESFKDIPSKPALANFGNIRKKPVTYVPVKVAIVKPANNGNLTPEELQVKNLYDAYPKLAGSSPTGPTLATFVSDFRKALDLPDSFNTYNITGIFKSESEFKPEALGGDPNDPRNPPSRGLGQFTDDTARSTFNALKKDTRLSPEQRQAYLLILTSGTGVFNPAQDMYDPTKAQIITAYHFASRMAANLNDKAIKQVPADVQADLVLVDRGHGDGTSQKMIKAYVKDNPGADLSNLTWTELQPYLRARTKIFSARGVNIINAYQARVSGYAECARNGQKLDVRTCVPEKYWKIPN